MTNKKITKEELCEISDHIAEKTCFRLGIKPYKEEKDGTISLTDEAQDIFNETYDYIEEVLNN